MGMHACSLWGRDGFCVGDRIDAFTLLRKSGWAQAMWSSLVRRWDEEGAPKEATVLTTMEGMSQARLAELVEYCYTGKITTSGEKFEDQLRLADFMQVIADPSFEHQCDSEVGVLATLLH